MSETSILNTRQWRLFEQQNASAGLKNKIGALKGNQESAVKGNQESADSRHDQLKKVCADFESLFVAHMMKEMRNSIPKNDLFSGGRAEEIYTSMLDEKYAEEISKNGSLGLGKQLYDTLSKNLAASKNLDANKD